MVCVPFNLVPYKNIIFAAANKFGVSQARIQATIMAESSGNTDATRQDRDGRTSYGLMQIRPDTARAMDPEGTGNLSDAQIASKLKTDTSYNIYLGTKYYGDMQRKYGNTTLASSANGGPMANEASVNCPGLRRWECPWDSSGCYGTPLTNCVPNTGYAPTRTYIQNIDTIESGINAGRC
jgi:soluble lytic murein transglycosylase-like protein